MLKNIKSTYFIKIIFSYIDDDRLLKFIKYNKSLQHLLKIYLYHYKLYSDRYIIFNTKREGKEYDLSGNLLYEGEFLDGKRNGYGKEYYSDQIVFEGEYLDGNKLKGKGYGKDKYNKGKIIYEINNENGKGKEYDIEGNLIFEGKYLNGKRNGYGREYDFSSLIFEGEYLNGKKHGWGREYSSKTLIFKGKYFNGVKWSGQGGYNYEGKIEYELINGKCSSVVDYGDITYIGEYLNGKKHGKGKEYGRYVVFYKLIYEGEFSCGKRKGIGKEYHYDKIIFEGEYLYNNRIRGKEYVNEILEFEGEYFHTKWNGKGYDESGNVIYELNDGCGKVKEYKNERLIYEGDYLNGKKHGKGKEYSREYLIYEGDYLNGKRHGKGKEYDNGKLIFDGEFIEGKRVEKYSDFCIII